MRTNRLKRETMGIESTCTTDESVKQSEEGYNTSTDRLLPSVYPSGSSTEETSHESAIKSELENFSDRKEVVRKRFLTTEDSEAISTLTNFYNEAFEKQHERKHSNLNNIEDFVNTTKETVQKIITYFKCINDFTSFDQKTQIIILKARIVSSLIVRATHDYEKDNHSYNLVHTAKPVECGCFKDSFGPENADTLGRLFQLHVALQDKYGKNSSLYSILHLIVLFHPCVPDLKNRQVVSDLQIKYITLLKHYLEAKFSYSESKAHLAFLLEKLNEVDSVGDCMMKIIASMELKDIDPLMSEVLNL